MEHSQILQILLTLALSGTSAWGGAKYAIRYLEKTTEKHDKMLSQIQCELKKVPTMDQCKESKVNCRADKVVAIKDILEKIDKLSDDVVEYNRRREDAKDDNTRLYTDISNRLARLEAKLESVMEKTRNGN